MRKNPSAAGRIWSDDCFNTFNDLEKATDDPDLQETIARLKSSLETTLLEDQETTWLIASDSTYRGRILIATIDFKAETMFFVDEFSRPEWYLK